MLSESKMTKLDIEITKQEENKLFGRREISGEISHFGSPTPKRVDLREILAAKLNTDKSLVSIRTIHSTFGGKTKFVAMVYDSQEMLSKFEPKFVVKRHPAEVKTEVATEEVKAE